MSTYKNRIITISGDPASGKGTVIQQLQNIYSAQGFTVHVESIGNIQKKVIQKRYKEMFPEEGDVPIGQMCSDPRFASTLVEIDKEIDSEIIKYGQWINSKARDNEIFIIDSRLAWKMIPDSFSVRLTADEKTAGERAFNDKNRSYSSVEEAIKDTSARKKNEIERFMSTYKVDLADPNNYRLIINTYLASIEDIAHTIEICEQYNSEGKKFAKTWASPETFWPTQSIGETCSKYFGFSIEDVMESMKNEGVYPDRPIYATSVKGSNYSFVSDGHHRIVASIKAGKTLIPYFATKQTPAATVSSKRQLSQIYDHEDYQRPDGTRFRYKEYPKVVERETGEYDNYDSIF